jgi:hypothetical protein
MPEQFRLHAGFEHLLLFAGRPEGSHTIDSAGLRQGQHRYKQRQGTAPKQNSHPILRRLSQTCLDDIRPPDNGSRAFGYETQGAATQL